MDFRPLLRVLSTEQADDGEKTGPQRLAAPQPRVHFVAETREERHTRNCHYPEQPTARSPRLGVVVPGYASALRSRSPHPTSVRPSPFVPGQAPGKPFRPPCSGVLPIYSVRVETIAATLGRWRHFPGRLDYRLKKSAFYTTTSQISGAGDGHVPLLGRRKRLQRAVGSASELDSHCQGD